MISRAILLSAVMGWSGSNLMPPTVEPAKPLTSAQLQAKAKAKSVSDMCKHKRKSKAARDLCARWEKHND